MKNNTKVTLNFSSNVICDSNGETIFHNKLFWSGVSSNVIFDSNDSNVIIIIIKWYASFEDVIYY